MARQNPSWTRDELILALDLYLAYGRGISGPSDPRVVETSCRLRTMSLHPKIDADVSFRSPASVYMKIENFRSLDPSEGGKGLGHGSRLDAAVWEEYAGQAPLLHRLARVVRDASDRKACGDAHDEEQEFPEGRILYRLHRMRERNTAVVARVKRRAERARTLRCCVCGFSFVETYGELGRGFIECHHTVPVSAYTQDMGTSAADLVLVCANCHRMLHRRRPWLGTDELRAILG